MAFIFRPQMILSWVDKQGGTRDSGWTTQNRSEVVPTDLLSVALAALPLTKAGQLAITYQCVHVIGGAAATNVYNIGDAASFFLKSAAGGLGCISIGDLNPAILKSDAVTVDATNADVINFLSKVYLYLGDDAGSPWASVRQMNRTRFPG